MSFVTNVILTGLEVSIKCFLIVGCFVIGMKIGLLTQQIIANVFVAFVVSVVLSAITGAFIGAVVDWVIQKYKELFVYKPQEFVFSQ